MRTSPILAGTETEDRIHRRISGARVELAAAGSMEWDAYVVNDELPVAYGAVREAIDGVRRACRAEREESESMALLSLSLSESAD